MPECRDCGAEVRWASTPRGKKVMLELDPEPWSLGKKLWRLEPGVEGLDGTPLTQLEIEQAGQRGETIEGYAVHWDVCGQERDQEYPTITHKDRLQDEKARQRVQEEAQAAPPGEFEPDKHGTRYGELYGKKRDQPIQDDLFNLKAPPPGLSTLIRRTIGGWRKLADEYEVEAGAVSGKLVFEKKAMAESLRVCALELEGLLGL